MLTALAGCEPYPRDAAGSTARADREAIRVGVSHEPPFVLVAGAGGQPTGPEVDMLRDLARSRGARIEWVVDGHDALMHELEEFRLHAVAGGHLPDSPWKPKVGWSRTYHLRPATPGPLHARMLALPPGENAWQLAVDGFLHSRQARGAAADGR
ncbi:transporter substrate-binding domain-containing protein [Luteimonas sp. RD2P54]|uniref:Transporter substrate-binding domain-containing protein n=1 Tax=Luteimonas endophytica TaxID=3042023 RepID=A0ABT6J8F1_9GAMM|nr:transporter substrate-binding domain-containing protein [Luteimonas endophytica]MDH5823104.1 transporter substrate-binding domain-containing protein [Luteimonas endophytica]